MNPRYRICARCHRRWNVSRKTPSPQNYICPACGHKMPPPVCETGDGIEKRDTTVIIDQKVRFVNNETI